MGFHMVPLSKRRVWRFFRAGPNGPSPPTHFGSNSSSKFQFWAIEGSLDWLPKEFFGIEVSVDWFLRPLLTIQAFCYLNFWLVNSHKLMNFANLTMFKFCKETQQFQEIVHQIFKYIQFWAIPFFSKVIPCESP